MVADSPRAADEDGDYDDEEETYVLHNAAEQGHVDRLRELLPLPSECSDPPPRLSVLSSETNLLEKDDMGFLPLHVAVIHQQTDCALHLLRYSPALTSAMLRLKGGDFGTPFLHLVLRVGAINASFSQVIVNELCKEETNDLFYGEDVRTLLFEKVAARDEEGNTVFHLYDNWQ
ncbi:Histone deacetylase [Phytophthora palmivora]|uniref:Histone deacetylase n=1 Tax=Phytophthora palmivora TaxID=4796 RepID=A0A2P4YBT6_9STRA|nr:Histone deacetylase [Phytophthora palmivora]